MKYFKYNDSIEKVQWSEEGLKVINDMIEEMTQLGIALHDKFVDEFQFFGVLKFEIDELFREQGFFIEGFDELSEAIANHDPDRLKETLKKMFAVSDNFYMEAFQVFGVLKKMMDK
jgi:hypothetical protein